MAKLIKKSKCKFEAGYIVRKGETVGIPIAVWNQLNKLELIVQQYDYLLGQPTFREAPSLDGFKRRSIFKTERPYAEPPETPVTDRRVKEAMEFMAEVDEVNDVHEINEAIDRFGELIDWCAKDKFIEGSCGYPIDTPMLGDPLTLSPERIATTLALIIKNPIIIEV